MELEQADLEAKKIFLKSILAPKIWKGDGLEIFYLEEVKNSKRNLRNNFIRNVKVY